MLVKRALLAAAVIGIAVPALAADEAEIGRVYDAVHARFPDLTVFCQLPEDERRKAVVQVTMQLASARKLADPFGAGPAAGVRLRAECGISAPVDLEQVRWTVTSAPLRFNPERGSLGWTTSTQALANRVYAPEGPGPFPAVVVSQAKKMSAHLRVHAQELLAAGFAVLVVDTFGPRGYQIGVNEPLPAEFARDAYDALAHLMSQSYIDPARIYQTGYSNGALAAALLADSRSAVAFKAPQRFRATVANYGSCTIASPYAGRGQATAAEMLSPQSDRPILMLMAALDIETPPQTCFPRLEEMKAAGKPVSWHVYPNTTHAWDQAEHAGNVYRTVGGESMTYRYDEAVARDATARMIEFFNRHR